jgi:DNA-binding NarL/FixJ family response regulator
MSKPRIVLADDHRIILEGLKKLLEAEFEVVEAVEDGRELLKAATRQRPDVIVADISMPNMNGLEAVRQIHKERKEIKIVFLTMHADTAYAANALETGASGYVLKNSAPDELVTAIHEALQGRTYVTPQISSELVRAYHDGKHRRITSAADLTPRQRKVLQLLADGHAIKDIAASLDISPKNVEYHKYRIMDLLGIKTTAELVRYAVQQGLVTR